MPGAQLLVRPRERSEIDVTEHNRIEQKERLTREKQGKRLPQSARASQQLARLVAHRQLSRAALEPLEPRGRALGVVMDVGHDPPHARAHRRIQSELRHRHTQERQQRLGLQVREWLQARAQARGHQHRLARLKNSSNGTEPL